MCRWSLGVTDVGGTKSLYAKGVHARHVLCAHTSFRVYSTPDTHLYLRAKQVCTHTGLGEGSTDRTKPIKKSFCIRMGMESEYLHPHTCLGEAAEKARVLDVGVTVSLGRVLIGCAGATLLHGPLARISAPRRRAVACPVHTRASMLG